MGTAFPAGYAAGVVVAFVYAGAAAGTGLTIRHGNAVFQRYGVLGANFGTASAAAAPVAVAHGLGGEFLSFGIVAPLAGHGTALEEYRGAYAVAVMYGVSLYVGYQRSGHKYLRAQSPLIF